MTDAATDPPAARVVLVLRDEREPASAVRRLKGVLKGLLRAWGWRCVELCHHPADLVPAKVVGPVRVDAAWVTGEGEGI